MKVLETNEQFYSEIRKLSSKNPKFFYVSSFNLNYDRTLSSILEQLPTRCDKKMIIGVTSTTSEKQISFLKRALSDMRPKLLIDCHLKLIVSNKGCIVGGRNLTQSEWDDLSILLIDKITIEKLKDQFLKVYKRKSI